MLEKLSIRTRPARLKCSTSLMLSFSSTRSSKLVPQFPLPGLSSHSTSSSARSVDTQPYCGSSSGSSSMATRTSSWPILWSVASTPALQTALKVLTLRPRKNPMKPLSKHWRHAPKAGIHSPNSTLQNSWSRYAAAASDTSGTRIESNATRPSLKRRKDCCKSWACTISWARCAWQTSSLSSWVLRTTKSCSLTSRRSTRSSSCVQNLQKLRMMKLRLR